MVWTVQVLAAIAPVGAGSAKLAGELAPVAAIERIGAGQWFRYVAAAVLLGLSLLVPWLRRNGVSAWLATPGLPRWTPGQAASRRHGRLAPPQISTYQPKGKAMTSLLAIEVSPRFEYSASRKLVAQFAEKWRADHPGGSVVVRDLMKTHLPYVDLPWIGGAFTPAEQHSPEMAEAIKVSDDLIAELKAADHIVIGTPMYNFSIPAVLKAYIDHVVRVGVTFTTDYKGLLIGKKATIILVSGGAYGPGSPAETYNVAGSYLRQILGFIGITDVTVVLAGQSLAIDQGTTTMDEFASRYEQELSAAAA